LAFTGYHVWLRHHGFA